jgi:arsenate reductase-like glutaredoxin family protein
MNIKIYHNPRCTKIRQTLAILKQERTDFKIIEYSKDLLSLDKRNYRKIKY